MFKQFVHRAEIVAACIVLFAAWVALIMLCGMWLIQLTSFSVSMLSEAWVWGAGIALVLAYGVGKAVGREEAEKH
jgi:hypothetical protein